MDDQQFCRDCNSILALNLLGGSGVRSCARLIGQASDVKALFWKDTRGDGRARTELPSDDMLTSANSGLS